MWFCYLSSNRWGGYHLNKSSFCSALQLKLLNFLLPLSVGSKRWLDWRREIELLSDLAYFGLTTFSGINWPNQHEISLYFMEVLLVFLWFLYLDFHNFSPQVTKPWAKNMSTSSKWVPLNVISPLGPDEASSSCATSSFLTSWTRSWCAWRMSWKVGRRATAVSVGGRRHPGCGAWSRGWRDGHRGQWGCCRSPRGGHACRPCLSSIRVWPSCTDSTWLFSTSVALSITCLRGRPVSAM